MGLFYFLKKRTSYEEVVDICVKKAKSNNYVFPGGKAQIEIIVSSFINIWGYDKNALGNEECKRLYCSMDAYYKIKEFVIDSHIAAFKMTIMALFPAFIGIKNENGMPASALVAYTLLNLEDPYYEIKEDDVKSLFERTDEIIEKYGPKNGYLI